MAGMAQQRRARYPHRPVRRLQPAGALLRPAPARRADEPPDQRRGNISNILATSFSQLLSSLLSLVGVVVFMLVLNPRWRSSACWSCR
jgi:hypothetical protein